MEWTITDATGHRRFECLWSRCERLQSALQYDIGRSSVMEAACRRHRLVCRSDLLMIYCQYEGRFGTWSQGGQDGLVHCQAGLHVLDRFNSGGGQLLDPVKPPRMGNTILVRQGTGSGAGMTWSVILIWVIGDCTGWNRSARKEGVCDGGPKHFILAATDFAISRVDDPMRRLYPMMFKFWILVHSTSISN